VECESSAFREQTFGFAKFSWMRACRTRIRSGIRFSARSARISTIPRRSVCIRGIWFLHGLRSAALLWKLGKWGTGKVGATHYWRSGAMWLYLTKIRSGDPLKERYLPRNPRCEVTTPTRLQVCSFGSSDACVGPALRGRSHSEAVLWHRRGWIRSPWSFCIDLRHDCLTFTC